MNTQTSMVSGSTDAVITDQLNIMLAQIERDGGVVKDIQFSSCGVPDGVWYSVLVIYLPAKEAE